MLTGAQIEEIWEDTTNGMKKNGMGIGIVNINSSPRLADALGIRHVPSIIGVINGYISFYSGSVTKQRLKDFVTGLFPGGLIQMVNAFCFQLVLICRRVRALLQCFILLFGPIGCHEVTSLSAIF